MCPSKLQTKIIAQACSCSFIIFQNKIHPRPGLESSADAAVQCYALADDRCRTVRWRHSVSWCSSPQVLIYCQEHWTVNSCLENTQTSRHCEQWWPVIVQPLKVQTIYEVSEVDPSLLEQFSACMQASVMIWIATDTLSRSYNISCRWKKRSFGQQILVSEQYLSPEGAELRPAICREGTFQRQHVQ